MTPTLIHRFTIPLQKAIEQLVGKEATDGEGYIVNIDGDELVIDIIGPTTVPTNEMAKSNVTSPEAEASPAEPPRKGGALARQAGIMCGEKGFWTFIGKKFGVTVGSADEAAAWLKAKCGVRSRVDLDHEEAPADNFRGIEKLYRLWLEGFD